jgi:hypothetical protein
MLDFFAAGRTQRVCRLFNILRLTDTTIFLKYFLVKSFVHAHNIRKLCFSEKEIV